MQFNLLPFPASRRTANTDHCSQWGVRPGLRKMRHWGSWQHETSRQSAFHVGCCDASWAVFLSGRRMLETGLIVGQMNDMFTHMHTHTNRNTILVNVWLTRLVNSAKGMSGVVFAGLEAVFTEVKVVTVPAFEPGAVYREHLTAITPADNTSCIWTTYWDT